MEDAHDRRVRHQRAQGARRLPGARGGAETGGTAVAVDDADLLADLALAGRLEGMFLCPEGAATVTAVRRLRAFGLARCPTTRWCCSTPVRA